MVDRPFEAELERLFADAPMSGDAELFAALVTQRLDRGWSLRQLLIGGLGLAGGLVGGIQLLRWGLFERLGGLAGPAPQLVSARLAELPIARTLGGLFSGGAPADLGVLSVSGGLALLAAGLLATRTFRAF